MQPIQFTTKANTLNCLENRLSYAKVLPQYCFTVSQWLDNNESIESFENLPSWLYKNVIVRSSGLAEDSSQESLAGHFTSIAHVQGIKALNQATNKVVESLRGNTENQIFIQPMLENVRISGVAFTRDPNNFGHYYVINYDDQSGKTNTVTDGSTNALTTFYSAKFFKPKLEAWMNQLLKLLEELETLFQLDALDVEFALSNDKLILLQVRPLILKPQKVQEHHIHVQTLEQIQKRFNCLSQPHPYLFGKRSVFGIMPDWNPAEIIGIRPRPLALSLYKELITDNIWAYQRNNYGYRNLRSFPLLISFSGMPYIDVRVSFNSFIPKNINESLAERLVNHYIDSLVKNPTYHDKVEFEIIYSCYTLDLPERLNKLLEFGFSPDDCTALADSLRNLTNNIIHGEKGLWKQDIDKLSILQQRQQTILSSELEPIDKIYWLIEDCKRYGTLPFAGLARAGFIAVQLLKSLVVVGVLSETDYESFLNSLNTISSSLSIDLSQLNKEVFLQKYGHLRPGTYDILSPRYDETPEQYFSWTQKSQKNHKADTSEFRLNLETLNKLEALLIEHCLDHDVLSLFNFIKSAIEGREYAKFIFSKSLSEILNLLQNSSIDCGFSVDDLSYVNIQSIKDIYSSSNDVKQSLQQSIIEGKKAYSVTQSLNLPPLITQEQDIIAFKLAQNEPNFITLKSITAQIVSKDDASEQLNGNIIMIPSADPGYDWIFSHHIGGFITMYGGTNSHMAIRAGELGIPAVIGAGESFYQQWIKAKLLEIDCANRQVKILQ